MCKRIEAVKVSGKGRVGYRMTFDGKEFALVRSTARPERMYAMDDKLQPAKVGGFKWFSDSDGELRGVRG